MIEANTKISEKHSQLMSLHLGDLNEFLIKKSLYDKFNPTTKIKERLYFIYELLEWQGLGE